MNWFFENVVMLAVTLATWAAIGLLILWVPLRLFKLGPFDAVLSYVKFFGAVSLLGWIAVAIWAIFLSGGKP